MPERSRWDAEFTGSVACWMCGEIRELVRVRREASNAQLAGNGRGHYLDAYCTGCGSRLFVRTDGQPTRVLGRWQQVWWSKVIEDPEAWERNRHLLEEGQGVPQSLIDAAREAGRDVSGLEA